MFVQGGNFTGAVIHRIAGAITASRNGTTIGPFEEPMILIVALETKTTFVHQSVVSRTKQHQVIELRFTTCGPVPDVMCIDKA